MDTARQSAEPAQWQRDALCRGEDPELFHPAFRTHTAYAKAVQVCVPCPVKRDCLRFALENELGYGIDRRHGVFGGLTPSQRLAVDKELRALRRSKENDHGEA